MSETLGGVDEWFPPQVLREYAFLADGERGVVVGPRGEFCWMCFPRWDSDAVFASLIGGNGTYAVTPRERFVWGGEYEPGSLIWRSRWVTGDGSSSAARRWRFPASPAVRWCSIIARDGDARVRVVCAPRPGFGEHRPVFRRHDGAWEAEAGGLRFRWSGAREARGTDRLELDLTVRAGSHHDLVLEIVAGPSPPGPPPSAARAWDATEAAWRRAVPEMRTIADRDARHAYAVMRGMTGASGGMVAAATTHPQAAGYRTGCPIPWTLPSLSRNHAARSPFPPREG
jgi:alpha,alpha-trehalase